MIDRFIDCNGETEFVTDLRNYRNAFLISPIAGKGLGIQIHDSQNRSSNTKDGSLLQTPILYGLPVGKHEDRVCWHCLSTLRGKAFQYESCRFCSKKCLQLSMPIVDMYLSNLIVLKGHYDTKPVSTLETSMLILRILCYHYHSCVHKSNDKIHERVVLEFQKILCLDSHIDCEESIGVVAECKLLHNTLEYQSPGLLANLSLTVNNNLVMSHSSSRKSQSPTMLLLLQLFRIVQYNAQRLPVLTLPNESTHIFCILSLFARINHSCAPNGSLSLLEGAASKYGSGTAVAALYDIKPSASTSQSCSIALTESGSQEVTMSYVSNLCIPYTQRREVLLAAFNFTCMCSRCQYEEQLTKRHSIRNNALEIKKDTGAVGEPNSDVQAYSVVMRTYFQLNQQCGMWCNNSTLFPSTNLADASTTTIEMYRQPLDSVIGVLKTYDGVMALCHQLQSGGTELDGSNEIVPPLYPYEAHDVCLLLLHHTRVHTTRGELLAFAMQCVVTRCICDIWVLIGCAFHQSCFSFMVTGLSAALEYYRRGGRSVAVTSSRGNGEEGCGSESCSLCDNVCHLLELTVKWMTVHGDCSKMVTVIGTLLTFVDVPATVRQWYLRQSRTA